MLIILQEYKYLRNYTLCVTNLILEKPYKKNDYENKNFIIDVPVYGC